MKYILQGAGAFVGAVVAAGFATGQEILQFFGYFGWWGLLGGIIVMILFGWFGYHITKIGSFMQADSHKQVFRKLFGKYLGWIIDVFVTVFMFGAASIMIAGAGSTLNEQFNVPLVPAKLIILVIVIITLMLNFQRILTIIGSFTPLLTIIALIIAIVSFLNMSGDLSTLSTQTQPEKAAAGNWVLAAFLYVSYNFAANVAVFIRIGRSSPEDKKIGWSGLLGGVTIGALVIIMHLGLMFQANKVGDIEIPNLFLANELIPWIAPIFALIILGMVYNTAVALLYTFTVRFFKPSNKNFKMSLIVSSVLAFVASFVGFSKLIDIIYPFMGYIGFLLMAAIIYIVFRNRRQNMMIESDENVS